VIWISTLQLITLLPTAPFWILYICKAMKLVWNVKYVVAGIINKNIGLFCEGCSRPVPHGQVEQRNTGQILSAVQGRDSGLPA
jgi:hypothetical protein